MLILGLLLVVVSGAAVALLIAYNYNSSAAEQTITLFGRDLATVSVTEAFVAGIVAALVFMLGLWMLAAASRRGRQNRAKYREARREAKTAAAERDELAEQLRHDDQLHHEHDRPAHDDRTMVRPAPQTVPVHQQPVYQQPVQQRPADGRPNAPMGNQPVITNLPPGQTSTK